MRFKISDASLLDCEWLVRKLDLYPTAAFVAVKATDKKGRIVGMVGCDHFTYNSCQMFIASDTPAAWLSMLRGGFDLAYNRHGMSIAYGVVRSDNEQSLRFTSKLGFKLVSTLKHGWAKGVHLLIFELEKADCVWLNTREDMRRIVRERRRRAA